MLKLVSSFQKLMFFLQARFEFHHGDYEKQFLHVLSRKDKTGIVINNPNQSVFLFIDRQHLQVKRLIPVNNCSLICFAFTAVSLAEADITKIAAGTNKTICHFRMLQWLGYLGLFYDMSVKCSRHS